MTAPALTIKIPLHYTVGKCAHDNAPIGSAQMFAGNHEIWASKMMKCRKCGKLKWKRASGGEGL